MSPIFVRLSGFDINIRQITRIGEQEDDKGTLITVVLSDGYQIQARKSLAEFKEEIKKLQA